jgi:3'-phosphoadenosine 5'-phosphosulfate sulfotransferase (PAPS reductase)/FAD synthetase
MAAVSATFTITKEFMMKTLLNAILSHDVFKDKDAVHFIGMSGGKDSALCVALAEYAGLNFKAFTCDTHHEKPETYAYLRSLHTPITVLTKHTTEDDFKARRANVRKAWAQWYYPQLGSARAREMDVHMAYPPVVGTALDTALEALRPTGDAFRDRLVIHGTMPQKTGKFCSLEMKTEIAWDFISDYLNGEHQGEDVYWWSGVRSQESKSREGLNVLADCNRDSSGYVKTFLPIYELTHDEVFGLLKYLNYPVNELYTKGDRRVGCGECFEANKQSIRNSFTRDPSALERILWLEREVATVNRRAIQLGCSYVPFFREAYRLGQYGNWASASQVFEWSKTKRGGKVVDDTYRITLCDSVYGLCG